MLSFPTRERGLKYLCILNNSKFVSVVPNTGTWIEIFQTNNKLYIFTVVPNTGTWIEIFGINTKPCSQYVVPNTGTWIEIFGINTKPCSQYVVPNTGTWIEILINSSFSSCVACRSQHGNVD